MLKISDFRVSVLPTQRITDSCVPAQEDLNNFGPVPLLFQQHTISTFSHLQAASFYFRLIYWTLKAFFISLGVNYPPQTLQFTSATFWNLVSTRWQVRGAKVGLNLGVFRLGFLLSFWYLYFFLSFAYVVLFHKTEQEGHLWVG